ncbi:hypothetical protein PFLUV_G00217800 [Perca fluviatilis]|uniref:Transmembrane protein 242 n=1 Tax=Perca fluviatilis TaxID=8168 RepID=A0A6A5EMC5_PERFL|nr:hypothetical protein PFLUV_G00217800 [Perca fluviatilis]
MTAAADENMPVDVGEGAQSDEEAKLQILKGAAFLTTVASAGMLAGFGSTLALAKKKSPGWFRRRARKAESGARAWRCCSHWRALKAGLLSLTVWKVLGVHSLSEFRQKMQSIFPSVPKTSEAAAGSQHLDWDSVFSSK